MLSYDSIIILSIRILKYRKCAGGAHMLCHVRLAVDWLLLWNASAAKHTPQLQRRAVNWPLLWKLSTVKSTLQCHRQSRCYAACCGLTLAVERVYSKPFLHHSHAALLWIGLCCRWLPQRRAVYSSSPICDPKARFFPS